MHRLVRACGVVIFVGAVALPCFAVSSPWDGTWKLNHAKSKLTGSTYTITQQDGRYHVKSGAFTFSYACDGKDYPTVANRTVSCTETANSMDSVDKADGKVIAKTHEVLSPDGRTDTEEETDFLPNGTTRVEKDVYTRIGNGSGFAGTWKETAVHDDTAIIQKIMVDNGVMHVELPVYKQVYSAKIDGGPAPLTGPDIPPGVTVTVHKDGDMLKSAIMLNGKTISERTWSLSPDGKTITIVSWEPGKPTERQVLIYEKQ